MHAIVQRSLQTRISTIGSTSTIPTRLHLSGEVPGKLARRSMRQRGRTVQARRVAGRLPTSFQNNRSLNLPHTDRPGPDRGQSAAGAFRGKTPVRASARCKLDGPLRGWCGSCRMRLLLSSRRLGDRHASAPGPLATAAHALVERATSAFGERRFAEGLRVEAEGKRKVPEGRRQWGGGLVAADAEEPESRGTCVALPCACNWPSVSSEQHCGRSVEARMAARACLYKEGACDVSGSQSILRN
eukprot:scaffold1411_cov396-Prasinococcus_capsulatus_cf.AAC.19